jgi:hypothetical protein
MHSVFPHSGIAPSGVGGRPYSNHTHDQGHTMHLQHLFPVHEIPFSDLGRPLTERELSGQLLKDLGLTSARHHQVGASALQAQANPRHVLFVHPADTCLGTTSQVRGGPSPRYRTGRGSSAKAAPIGFSLSSPSDHHPLPRRA